MAEFIIDEGDWGDAWVCICANRPDLDGFYACDAYGFEVEPTVDEWDGIRYACVRCGRIIRQDTLQVIGQRHITAEYL